MLHSSCYQQVIREGLRAISLVTALFLIGCVNPKPPKVEESNLSFVNTLLNDINGEVLRREIGMMKDSLKQGLWISFYPDGKIYGIEFFDNGKWNGPWYYFHKNGQLMMYHETKNGKWQGKGYNYYSNGVLMSKANFVNDRLDGEYEEYEEDGTLFRIWEYKNGAFVKAILGTAPLPDEE